MNDEPKGLSRRGLFAGAGALATSPIVAGSVFAQPPETPAALSGAGAIGKRKLG